MKRILWGGLLVMFAFVSPASSQTESQWRGQNRDGIYPEKNLLKKWPAAGPELLWSVTGIGSGFSSVAVANEKVYINGMIDGNGMMQAYDLNGKLVWKTNYGPEWMGDFPGCRSTATVVDGRLYVHSAIGRVVCLDAQSGKLIWAVDLKEKFGAQPPQWGIAESVLIDGNKLFCTPGGPKVGIAALDRLTGKTLWECTEHAEKSGYCSPILIYHNKNHLLVTMTAKTIVAVNPETGKLIWKFPHETAWDVNANTPFYKDGNLYCVSGYGTGGVQLKLSADGRAVTEVWRNQSLDSQMGATVFLNGYLYGSGQNKKYWQCLDWDTGEVKWMSDKRGKGNIIFADGQLYLYDESGEVFLVEPSPTEFKLVSSFRVTQGTDAHWAHLVIAKGRLFVRHGDALLAYKLTK